MNISAKNVALKLLTTIVVVMATALNAQAQGLLWEVKSPTRTMYLFGSIHLAKADFYPLPEKVEAAYTQADTLVVEADITDTIASKNALALMRFTAPDNLQKHLSKTTWKLLKTAAGENVEQFELFKPAVVAVGLSMASMAQQGYEPQYGIDLHFIERASFDKKKLVELESLAFQAGVLGGLNDADGDALLRQTLTDFANGTAMKEAQQMIAAWKAGDAAALAKSFTDASKKDAGTKKLMKRLLDERNIGMAKKITRLLADESKAFVVVGAGHLTGANSIIDLLNKQGLQVRQIQ
jgi:uncharacterized protein YbaP (TraB family)